MQALEVTEDGEDTISDFLSTVDLDFNRLVPCYCGKTKVVSRRDPSKDKYVVCSRECWDRMVQQDNQEPGSLMREVLQ